MTPAQPRPSTTDRLARLTRPRVLVVDDLEDNRIILGRRLARRGFEIAEACDGAEALERIAEGAYDLVLLDAVMPRLDGFEALERIRQRYTPAQLPVIMVTVRDASADVVRAMKLGANDYVTKPFDFEVVHARIESHVRLKQLAERAEASQPELEGLIAGLRDAVKRAEATAQAKAELLANMSHEIRTPLNGMLALSEILAGKIEDPELRMMARTVADSSASLERLLSDVLDLSRADAGKLEIRAEPFEPAEVLRRVAALFRSAAADKGVELTAAAAPAAEVVVRGDELRLQQILTNLIGNAVKFTAQGRIQCSLAAADDGLRFEVQDTGIGFDPAKAEALFARFEQADGSIAPRFGGSGLGLAISRRLAGLMGGTLTASSAQGEGATFTLVLPLPVSGPAVAMDTPPGALQRPPSDPVTP